MLWFRYDIIRIWIRGSERLLTSGLPLLLLAPVSNVAAERLLDVLTAVANRLRDEAGAQLTMTLWTATAILTGLRYSREQVGEMIEECENGPRNSRYRRLMGLPRHLR